MLRVRTVFSGVQGAPWVSTIHMAGTDQTSANAAVVAVGDFWQAVDAHMNTAVTWATEAEVESIDPVSGALVQAFATTPEIGAGGTVTELLPRPAQLLVRLRTGVIAAGREIRGRIFVPGMTELANTAGQVTASVATDVTTAANALDAAGLVVWSKAHGIEAITSTVSVWAQWAYLGSRRD